MSIEERGKSASRIGEAKRTDVPRKERLRHVDVMVRLVATLYYVARLILLIHTD